MKPLMLSPSTRNAVCFGVSFWNRKALGRLLTEGGDTFFTDDFPAALQSAKSRSLPLHAWASKLSDENEAECLAAGTPLIRVEDGFIRSAGLGAGLIAGASYAFDKTGIYYDARRTSDIETVLQTAEISAAEIARGSDLRQAILSARISKYNVGRLDAPFAAPAERDVILVPGQVSNDAAVSRAGAAALDNDANVNLTLLRRVRERHPTAFIVYKPHPDVETGLRRGALTVAETRGYADAVINKASILTLIARCDAVETLSSLTGFEALLRGKPVTVHGAPFYAGWGLTEDLTPTPRRTRRRSLEELVFVMLALYTRHVDPITLEPCSPESLIASLTTMGRDPRQRAKAAVLQRVSWVGRKLGV